MNARYPLGLLAVSLWLLGGCGHTEMRYVLSDEAKKLSAEAQEQLAASLEEVFGTPAEPLVAAPVVQLVKTNATGLAAGAKDYRLLCMHCHGLTGDGSGPTAGPKERPWLNPRPRDYRPGKFKFTSTVDGAKPSREDLLRTIRNGIAGTSMP